MNNHFIPAYKITEILYTALNCPTINKLHGLKVCLWKYRLLSLRTAWLWVQYRSSWVFQTFIIYLNFIEAVHIISHGDLCSKVFLFVHSIYYVEL